MERYGVLDNLMSIEITIAPIVAKDSLHKGIQEQITAYFKEVLFQPLLELLQEHNIKTNAVGSAVASALQAKRIWYIDGTFIGAFNAKISRELRAMGARWDERGKVFKLPLSQMPYELRQTIAASTQAAADLNKKVLEVLGQIEANAPKAETGLSLKFSLDGVFVDLREQYKRSLEAHGIAVPADLTEHVKADIAKEYTNNMDKFIKDFTTKTIPQLRTKVQANIFAGGRTDKLSQIIEAEYNVSRRKAEFLAEQETSLLVSKYRESRYKSLGSRRYVWSGSGDGRERHDHNLLNGQTFYWDQPPVTNRATGERNHPGEDFGCRCVARPILPIQED